MHTVLVYDPGAASPQSTAGCIRQISTSELPALLVRPEVTIWLDLCAPVDEADEALLRDVFRFHPMTLEDTFAAREQPKIAPFDGYLYVITHGLLAGSTADFAESLELDAFLGKNFLVTHHAKPSRSVAGITDAVLRDGGPMRRGSTLLLHAILDTQIEGISEVVEGIEARLEELEGCVFAAPRTFDLEGLLDLKRTMLKLRRFMSRQRDVVLRIGRQEFGLVSSADSMLFRDLHDQLTRLVDLVENYREMAISILDVYLAMTNNRLNETMRFLAVFTAVLMPMTVITGVYGMNFEHMPELRAVWGYPMVLGTMAVTSFLVVRFFRKRGMIGAAMVPAPAPRIAEPEAIAPSASSSALQPVTGAWRRTAGRRTVSSIPSHNP